MPVPALGGLFGGGLSAGGGSAGPSSAFTDGNQEVGATLGGTFAVGSGSKASGGFDTKTLLIIGGVAVVGLFFISRR